MDIKKINEIKDLILQSNDQAAYAKFRELYYQEELVTQEGNDTKLAQVANEIGFMVLHMNKEWQREVSWWESVLETQKQYDKDKSKNLHKGLVNHNIVLPLLELNQPETAVKYLKIAYTEDVKNFGEIDALSRPAYKLGCFLIPIVETHKWVDNDSGLSEDERTLLVRSFEMMFVEAGTNSTQGNQLTQDILSKITDSNISKVLVKRYMGIIRNIDVDPVVVATYTGSILESLLTILLQKDSLGAIKKMREIGSRNPGFICFNHNNLCTEIPKIINKIAPDINDEDELKLKIRGWSFNQKIDIAKELGIFGKSKNTTLFIICHLLREYRNIIHPTNQDTLGFTQDWDIMFELNPKIARMLKKALDIVVHLIEPDVLGIQPQVLFMPDMFKKLAYSGIDTRSSLASPSIPGSFDEKGNFTPFSTSTSTSTSNSISSNPVMGSTTTTLPYEKDKH